MKLESVPLALRSRLVGQLSAGAAHELATLLGTISVVETPVQSVGYAGRGLHAHAPGES